MIEALNGLHILLIDDDMDFSETLHTGLAAAGAKITTAGSVEEGVKLAGQGSTDLVLLNLSASIDASLSLEALGGMETPVPVILITGSQTDSEDTVSGLELGADDYLMKPFTIHDLSARIASVLQGYDRTRDTVLIAGDLIIDRQRNTVLCQAETLDIQPEELEILTLLAERENETVSESELLSALYGKKFDTLLKRMAERLASASSACQIKRDDEGIRLQVEDA